MEKIEADTTKCEIEKKKIARIQNDIKFQTEQITEYEKTYVEDLNHKKDPLIN